MYQKKAHENNENNVFRYVFYSKNNFVINDISENLDISFPTAKKIVNSFLEKEIIFEEKKVGNGVGRKAMEYSFNDFFCYSIGVRITKNSAGIILTNAKGIIIKEKTEFFLDTVEIQNEFLNLIKTFIKGLSNNITDKLIGIGISVPGIISKEDEFIEFSSHTKVHLSFINQMRDELKFPVFMENESNLASIAEGFLTKHSACSLFTVLTINDYVGISNFQQENLKKDFYFKAGRLHHMIVESGGRLCECGSKGCWGAYVSDKSLLSDFQKVFPNIKNFGEIFVGKYTDTKDGKKILDNYIKYLAVGIKNILFFSNPEKLIISGKICFYKDIIREQLLDEIYKDHIFYRGRETVVFSNFNDNSIIIGAAMFPIIDNLF
ncbi:ROK family protein [Fusobacterium sp. MFO224]|uniref:ROK family protein n=1 Tax=Fusobacterium sp. MFO224 TaxID=3378070 RepID=UPI003852348C